MYSTALARKVEADPAVIAKLKQIDSAGTVTSAIYVNGKALPADELNALSWVYSPTLPPFVRELTS